MQTRVQNSCIKYTIIAVVILIICRYEIVVGAHPLGDDELFLVTCDLSSEPTAIILLQRQEMFSEQQVFDVLEAFKHCTEFVLGY